MRRISRLPVFCEMRVPALASLLGRRAQQYPGSGSVFCHRRTMSGTVQHEVFLEALPMEAGLCRVAGTSTPARLSKALDEAHRQLQWVEDVVEPKQLGRPSVGKIRPFLQYLFYFTLCLDEKTRFSASCQPWKNGWDQGVLNPDSNPERQALQFKLQAS